jgi:hypothetical protein
MMEDGREARLALLESLTFAPPTDLSLLAHAIAAYGPLDETETGFRAEYLPRSQINL